MEIKRFENAFGIKDLSIRQNKKLKNMCIYASNGTFKTSFSKAIDFMTKEDGVSEVRDRVRDVDFIYDITHKGVNYQNGDGRSLEDVIVYSKDIYEESKMFDSSMVSKLVALPSVQAEMKNIITDIEGITADIVRLIKPIKIKDTGNIQNFKEIVKSDKTSDVDILLDFLKEIKSTSSLKTDFLDLSKIHQLSYDIIDKNDFQDQVKSYLETLNHKFTTELFDADFNDLNYNKLIEEIKSVNFLNSHRQIKIGDKYFDNIDCFSAFINKEVEKIKRDDVLKKKYDDVVKTTGSRKESEVVRELIKDTEKMNTLMHGRTKIKLSAIKEVITDDMIDSWTDNLNDKKKRITELIDDSKNEKSRFEEAISIYKRRFIPVFDIVIDNIEDSKIGMNVPLLKFIHKDNKDKKYDEDSIYPILSSGEQSALKIIHLIVMYEINKDNKPMIILDDIVDTFDYSNKYAFLMYINDIIEEGSSVIVLTHNFDFFRSVEKRTNLDSVVAFIDNNNKVVLQQNDKFFKLYANLESEVSNEIKLYSLIPILREILIIYPNQTDEIISDIDFLTNLLHYKKETESITISQIIEVVQRYNKAPIDLKATNEKYLDNILNLNIKLQSSVDIEKKLVKTIALRIMIEKKTVAGNFELLDNIKGNQMFELYKLKKDDFNSDFLELYDEARLITPEFIHINSFMYEPLIDVCHKQIKDVYRRAKETPAY